MSITFDFQQSKKDSEDLVKKGALRHTTIVVCMMVVGLLLGDLARYSVGNSSLILEAPSIFFEFLLIPAMFAVYLNLTAMIGFAGSVGYSIFKDYAKSTNASKTNILQWTKEEVIQQLLSMNGKTYDQLNDYERSIAHQAIAYELYSPEWLFDQNTLKEIYKCNNQYEFYRVISSSKKIINIKEKFIRRRPGMKIFNPKP